MTKPGLLQALQKYGIQGVENIVYNPDYQTLFKEETCSGLAGTERGISEPTPTFSACFGAAFLSPHPTKYAEVLKQRMEQSGAKAYLVNTGWNSTGELSALINRVCESN